MYNSGQAGLTFWAPTINVFRDSRWGRGQERIRRWRRRPERDIANLLEQKKVIEDEKTAIDNKNSELQASVDELKKLVERMRVKRKHC